MWDFEAVDSADITDEKNLMFEMDPMYELKVSFTMFYSAIREIHLKSGNSLSFVKFVKLFLRYLKIIQIHFF